MRVSIVVPLHNAELNSTRLLATLRALTLDHVEAILVDDGSTDGTLHTLEATKADARIPVTVIHQDNRGPGGARNSGLRAARGTYVWFVDADDDISEEALAEVVKLHARGFDFIDFNVTVADRINENALGSAAGAHTVGLEERTALLEKFGRLHSKAFRREWLLEHNVLYPEYCLYEDVTHFCVLPLLTTTYFKSDTTGYTQHLEFDSVTRGKLSPRYFDRLWNVSWAIEEGLRLATTDAQRQLLSDMFVEMYPVRVFQQVKSRLYTPRSNLRSVISSKNPLRMIREMGIRAELTPRIRMTRIMIRVMRQFRTEQARLGLTSNVENQLQSLSAGERRVFRRLWRLSAIAPASQPYFRRLRIKAWGRPFEPSPLVTP